MHRRPRLLLSKQALAENYERLNTRSGRAQCAASVKANGYGLGIAFVAPVLWDAGCRAFFVAYLEEGVALRALLPDATIYVFHGPTKSLEAFQAHRLRPVMNTLEAITDSDWWSLEPALHIDTGMRRLGVPPDQIERVLESLPMDRLSLCMSHLACADAPEDPMNEIQRRAFVEASAPFVSAGVPMSLANTGGVLLGESFHFDLTRPGIGLYGGSPDPTDSKEFQAVCQWQAMVIQSAELPPNTSIGYGGSYQTSETQLILTVSVGYADGYLRALGNRAAVVIEGFECPVVGRVSMDLITVDATALKSSGHTVQVGDWVELMGRQMSLDRLALAGDTIGYELLTRLGPRLERRAAS